MQSIAILDLISIFALVNRIDMNKMYRMIDKWLWPDSVLLVDFDKWTGTVVFSGHTELVRGLRLLLFVLVYLQIGLENGEFIHRSVSVLRRLKTRRLYPSHLFPDSTLGTAIEPSARTSSMTV